ncbi:hypothetical protein MLD38_027395 [Melastoma candidum]|uniref:Uncharacterized protein n=1 Tax=Melastoma candidum TaxID=119954 RepID=A0ACB9P3F9_9MYRT|nr:hypothetical protein MLD38_027395 [Melastoma candidum]
MPTAAVIESLIVQVLLPSWWEIKVSVAASLFVIAAYWFFTYGADGERESDRSLMEFSGDSVDAGGKVRERVPLAVRLRLGLVVLGRMSVFWR